MNNKNRLTTGELVGRILIGAVALAAAGMYFDNQNRQSATLDNKELLTLVVTEQRKQLPKIIDQATTWYSIDHTDNELIHGYLFADIDITELKQDKIHLLQKALPLGLKDYVCKQSVYKRYWKRGIKLTYVMKDKNEKDIAQSSFTRAECTNSDS